MSWQRCALIALLGSGCWVTDRYVVERSTIAPLLVTPTRLPPDNGHEVRRIGDTMMFIHHVPDKEDADDRDALHLYEVRAVSDRGVPFDLVVRGELRDPNPAPTDVEARWQLASKGIAIPPITHEDTPEAIDAIAKREFVRRGRLVARRDDPTHTQAFLRLSEATIVDDTPGTPTLHMTARRELSELWVGMAAIATSTAFGVFSGLLIHAGEVCAPHCGEFGATGVGAGFAVAAIGFAVMGTIFIRRGVTLRSEEARDTDSHYFVLRSHPPTGSIGIVP